MTSIEQKALPSTAVPGGITDPVESARAELKAALAAIERRVNVPRRAERAIARGTVKLRRAHAKNPTLVVAGIVTVAAAVGGGVWFLVRALST